MTFKFVEGLHCNEERCDDLKKHRVIQEFPERTSIVKSTLSFFETKNLLLPEEVQMAIESLFFIVNELKSERGRDGSIFSKKDFPHIRKAREIKFLKLISRAF